MRIAISLGLMGLLSAQVGAAAGATSGRPYRTQHGAYRATARFVVTYSGSGTFHTRYRSEPPNAGGAPDHNSANDSSTQKWSLRYRRVLSVPVCRAAKTGGKNPCTRLKTLAGASGPELATGRVAHVHIDGLFPSQNASISCRVKARTPKTWLDRVFVDLHYNARARTLALVAEDPMVDGLIFLPAQCPGQGDSIDGLNDNYFTPGFSLKTGWGPDRWFRAKTIVIPLRDLHRARTITIRLSDTRQGTPPKHCAAPFPAWQQCTTGGSWKGTLTLRATR
jgi:hypothetical protein